MAPACAAGAIF
jgi:hypothetical protein